MIFLPHVADLLPLIKCYQLLPNAYNDDTQIYTEYGFCRPSNVDILSIRVSTPFETTGRVPRVSSKVEAKLRTF